jgi:hypothetical protein
METQYEIQIQHYEGSNLWVSVIDDSNNPVFRYNSEEEANNYIEKFNKEYYPKLCRVIKIEKT